MEVTKPEFRFVPRTVEAYTFAQQASSGGRRLEVNGDKANTCRCCMLIISIGCSIIFSTPIAGQTVGDPAKAQMQEMDRREMQLSNVGGDKGPSNDAANRSLSYQFISDATGEIRKRSARLQSSLKLQKPEPTIENRGTRTDLKTLGTKDELILLCKQIESFLRNPIIDKPGTVDAQQLGKARRDLQSIVELSDEIKKVRG